MPNLTATELAFYGLSVLTLFTAVMVVFSKKPVHSVIFLISCFFTVAGHYILMNAQFLAAVHVIVYAGAIMVLFLFTIMFLNLNADVEPHKPAMLKLTAVISSGILMVVLVGVLKGAENAMPVPGDGQIGLVKNLGRVLYDQYMLPFEISAVLFLSAMVGVVMIGKKEMQ